MSLRLKSILAGVALAAALPSLAQAQWWQQHPAYIHAMSDLRVAYWMISHRGGYDPYANASEQHALYEIQAAYRELKIASIIDAKDIHDNPPPEMYFGDHSGRLHQALGLLQQAHDDVSREEDDPSAMGLRQRALTHLDISIHATQHAINDYTF